MEASSNMNGDLVNGKPSWAQNPVQHSDVHHRVSDEELHRRLAAADAKEKHQWGKPEWALQTNTVAATKPIDKTSMPGLAVLKKTPHAPKMQTGYALAGSTSPEDLEALQRKLAAARAKPQAEDGQAIDPTANMTPEEKAKYIADQRLEAIRQQTQEKELLAWKENQAERTAWERQQRELAKQKALQRQKEEAEREKIQREKAAALLQKEKEAQQAKEAEIQQQQQAASVSAKMNEVELLQAQIAALQAQLTSAGGATVPAVVPVSPTPKARTVSSPVASPVPVVVASSPSKKHTWSKPGWALPDESIQQEPDIVTDSIQNGLKAPSTGGYERKVFAKELPPPLVQGKFVRNVQEKKPPPRMVWIVVNINGIKRGKIVMHLYGNSDAIVEKFSELQGLEMNHSNGMLLCDELEPHFYVTAGKANQMETIASKKPQAVFGCVLEGQEVLQLALQAKDDAVISIRQSHIFPVKRGQT